MLGDYQRKGKEGDGKEGKGKKGVKKGALTNNVTTAKGGKDGMVFVDMFGMNYPVEDLADMPFGAKEGGEFDKNVSKSKDGKEGKMADFAKGEAFAAGYAIGCEAGWNAAWGQTKGKSKSIDQTLDEYWSGPYGPF